MFTYQDSHPLMVNYPVSNNKKVQLHASVQKNTIANYNIFLDSSNVKFTWFVYSFNQNETNTIKGRNYR